MLGTSNLPDQVFATTSFGAPNAAAPTAAPMPFKNPLRVISSKEPSATLVCSPVLGFSWSPRFTPDLYTFLPVLGLI